MESPLALFSMNVAEWSFRRNRRGLFKRLYSEHFFDKIENSQRTARTVLFDVHDRLLCIIHSIHEWNDVNNLQSSLLASLPRQEKAKPLYLHFWARPDLEWYCFFEWNSRYCQTINHFWIGFVQLLFIKIKAKLQFVTNLTSGLKLWLSQFEIRLFNLFYKRSFRF